MPFFSYENAQSEKKLLDDRRVQVINLTWPFLPRTFKYVDIREEEERKVDEEGTKFFPADFFPKIFDEDDDDNDYNLSLSVKERKKPDMRKNRGDFWG